MLLNNTYSLCEKWTEFCPCGYHGDSRHPCTCTSVQIHRYRSRVSGPLLDRFDIHIEVPAVPYKDISSQHSGETSAAIKGRVMDARRVQLGRLAGDGIYSNAAMNSRQLKKFCRTDKGAESLMEAAMRKLGLSARAYTRILKLARTIADLDRSEGISSAHVSEAIQYRTLDRRLA